MSYTSLKRLHQLAVRQRDEAASQLAEVRRELADRRQNLDTYQSMIRESGDSLGSTTARALALRSRFRGQLGELAKHGTSELRASQASEALALRRLTEAYRRVRSIETLIRRRRESVELAARRRAARAVPAVRSSMLKE